MDQHETGWKVYIGNLPSNILKKELSKLLAHYGTVLDLHIMRGHSKTRQSCAMAVYSDRKESDRCIGEVNGSELLKGYGPLVAKCADTQRTNGKGKKGYGKGNGKRHLTMTW